ncbi:MAG: phospho-N-acetylmuramoyl-pentapeptide-transferase [Patescibacteria group bacterium]|nr:phospho-N-acetylmuramoyl-pentapeptide-transferase [Patescibacteria group bacterium]MDE2588631.1 phospho-N-acetylmuramoyl-pentapeptide-transferase [Patescibacteria group bacterium]
MAQFLGLTILSAFITSMLLVPFIDFLYRIKLQRQDQHTKDPFNKRTPIFDKFNAWKVGTPVGGGLLIILVVSVLTLWAYGLLNVSINPWTIAVILITFLGYGALGLYDDLKKLTNNPAGFFGLRLRHKLIIQCLIALIIAFIIYTKLGYSFIFIRGIGLASVGFLYIPFAAFVIVAFTNAANITDGLDGLAAGLFLICLGAFLAITASQIDPSLGIFVAILIGAVGAFLYFNIYKARIWLGDVGSLSLGAILAVVGLLTGKTLALTVIGGVFVLEIGSSLLQMLSKKFLKRKIFAVSPLHLYLQYRGWDEPKIVMRAWLVGFFFAIIGLYLAFIR